MSLSNHCLLKQKRYPKKTMDAKEKIKNLGEWVPKAKIS